MSLDEGPRVQFNGARVFLAALGVWRQHFFVLTATAFVANLGVWVLGEAVRGLFGPTAIWLDLILDALINAVIILMAQDALTGGGVQLMPHIKRVQHCLGPVIVLSMTATMAVAVGLAILIVPGIYLAALWMAAQPALLLERDTGWRALGRSFELSQPYVWPIAGVLLRAGLTVGLAAVMMLMLLGQISLSTDADVLAAGAAVLTGSALSTFLAVLSLLVYLRLRELTDGGDASEVFR